MADNPQDAINENAKKVAAAGRAAADKSREEYGARMKGKPTPTQEENDLAVCGHSFDKHEEDGSDPDPGAMPIEHRHLEGQAGAQGTYQTRQSTAARPPTPPRPPSSS